MLLTRILETCRSAWGAPHDPGDRIKSASHRDKIKVPGMLLTKIGVLEVLLIGVLIPSGSDNLAIGVSPVGEKAYFALARVQYVEVIKNKKMNRSKNIIKRSR